MPSRPCLSEHRRGYGTSKFCRDCSPSCTICGSNTYSRPSRSCCPRTDKDGVCVSFSDSGLQSVQDYFSQYSSSGCLDPMWRAGTGTARWIGAGVGGWCRYSESSKWSPGGLKKEEDFFFCDSCFWMRLLVVGGLVGPPVARDETRYAPGATLRQSPPRSFSNPSFERLEVRRTMRNTGFLRDERSGCLVEEMLDGQNGARDEYGNCESCGAMFPTHAVYFVEDWCSKCRPSGPDPVVVDEDSIASTGYDEVDDRIGAHPARKTQITGVDQHLLSKYRFPWSRSRAQE